MFNENYVYVAPKQLHIMPFGIKDKITAIKRENFFGKWLWIIHFKDSYGRHLERYYNNLHIKRKILNITEKRGIKNV